MMEDECVASGPTVEDAVDAALQELGVQQDAVEYEVLEEPGKRLFSRGSDREARVRVWLKESYLASLEEARAAAAEALGVQAEEEDALYPSVMAEERETLSDEELDRIADAAVSALREILARMGIEAASVEEYEGDEGEIILDVVGVDLGLLIGRHGRTLDALQATVGAITTRAVGFRYPVVVDVEGYRHRRRQKIEEIARRGADRAARQRQPVHLRPMTAYERRVVHMALRGDARVITTSEGQEPYRQVVILPK